MSDIAPILAINFCRRAPKKENSLFFSLLGGNLRVGDWFGHTASSARHFSFFAPAAVVAQGAAFAGDFGAARGPRLAANYEGNVKSDRYFNVVSYG
jgi:hypothetical protein